MTDFYTEYLKDAKSASTSTGFLVSVTLAQWSIETGAGGTLAKGPDHWNFAGVTSPQTGELYDYPNEAAGLDGYISCALQHIYDGVRSAQGWQAQCAALGLSPWAAAHYDAADYYAAGQPADGTWTPPNPGIDLAHLILANNLTQYDGAQAQTVQPDQTAAVGRLASLPKIPPPPLGLSSDVEVVDFYINGSAMDLDVTAAVVTAQLDLAMSQASTFTLTLHDPDQILIALPIFTESVAPGIGALVTFQNNPALSFSLVSVEKAGSVLTVTFEAYVVAALRTANGPITTSAGQVTRTAFAQSLVDQVVGASFSCPPDAWLYAQVVDRYDVATQEQISRGTAEAPLEDSWTCLQRLAAEIDWVCFECYGNVYFGPESYLAGQSPVMTPAIGQSGIIDIDGTYDVGQSNATLTITATADTWVSVIGEAVLIQGLGLFDGTWIVSEIERDDVEEPEITITVSQPQPQLPEPTSGGVEAAVGATVNPGSASSQQTPTGTTAAEKAVAFCIAQAGKQYSETIDGGVGPAAYDCSGLVQAAYATVGIPIPRTTTEQWGDSSIVHVQPGIKNLRPGDLVYFTGGDPPPPGHVAIVTQVNLGTNDVIVFNAYTDQVPLAQQIAYNHFGYVNPGGSTAFAGTYYGALRPSQ